MKLIAQPKLHLTDEEKKTLREASEIIKEITDALEANTANGFSAFQEGLNAPDCFWGIYYNCIRIHENDLIP